MPDGAEFLCIARTLEGPQGSFSERPRRTALLLGCDIGFRDEIVYGVPCTCAGGKYEVIRGLAIDEFSRAKMDNTLKELLEERDGVKHLLG